MVLCNPSDIDYGNATKSTVISYRVEASISKRHHFGEKIVPAMEQAPEQQNQTEPTR